MQLRSFANRGDLAAPHRYEERKAACKPVIDSLSKLYVLMMFTSLFVFH